MGDIILSVVAVVLCLLTCGLLVAQLWLIPDTRRQLYRRRTHSDTRVMSRWFRLAMVILSPVALFVIVLYRIAEKNFQLNSWVAGRLSTRLHNWRIRKRLTKSAQDDAPRHLKLVKSA